MHHRLPLALVLSLLVVLLSSQPQQAQLPQASTPISESMSLPGNVVVVVGDLVPAEAGAPQADAAAVARLTAQHDPDALIHMGDLQYHCGSTQLFETRYGIHYGAMKPIIRPDIGNHEYCNGSWPDAPGYFAYFGAQAKPSGASYFSWNLILPSGRAVHFLNLNSNCLQWNKIAPGCGMTQAMRTWIRQDLAADNSDCVIATWHEPAFGSEVPFHGDGKDAMRGVWETLQSRGVDYIITGHAHNYQRYRAMHHNGTTTAPAIASAIVGTGGRSIDDVTSFSWQSKLVALDDRHFGVMKMVFNSTGTGWTQAFKTTTGASLDAVSFGCNNNK